MFGCDEKNWIVIYLLIDLMDRWIIRFENSHFQFILFFSVAEVNNFYVYVLTNGKWISQITQNRSMSGSLVKQRLSYCRPNTPDLSHLDHIIMQFPYVWLKYKNNR